MITVIEEDDATMPVPLEFSAAGAQFSQLLRDARDYAGLTTNNQSFTMVEGVLLAFRRRVTVRDGLCFADALPAVARAVFVRRWNVDAAPIEFGDRAAWTRDAQGLRPLHNDAPDTCVSNVAAALWRNTDRRALLRCLEALPAEATEFWTPTPADMAVNTLEHSFPGPVWMAPGRVGRPGSDRRAARIDEG